MALEIFWAAVRSMLIHDTKVADTRKEEMETDQKPIIHYSDTDSAHVNQESLQELIDKYQEKYNQPLNNIFFE